MRTISKGKKSLSLFSVIVLLAGCAVAARAQCGGTVLSENFDAVTAPALPAGWVATNPDPGNGVLWVTSTSVPDTAPNAAFIDDQDGISDKVLDSRPITITSASAQISFRNNFNMEYSGGEFWDGGVLEVSSPNISGGAFLDITDSHVGGSFVGGGYTGEIFNGSENPLSGRLAWSGSSGGYINTVANLGPNVNGQTIRLRFRMGSDVAVAAPGWRIDTIVVSGGSCGPTPTPAPTSAPTPTPGGPTPTPPAQVKVSLPTDSFNTSVPVTSVIIEPAITTYIAPSSNYVGFQGNFTFDSAVVTFSSPFVQAAGLTATGWAVSGTILNTGPGTLKTLQVTAFSTDSVTPLNGSGTLCNLRMLRVSSAAGATSPLLWAADPNNLVFFDTELSVVAPNQNNGLITITTGSPMPTPTPSPTATAVATATPTPTPIPTATPSPVPVTGTATWSLNALSGDWNNTANWTPAQVPNGPNDRATFGLSAMTSVSISGSIQVDGVTFNSPANAFTIATNSIGALTISGAGILNDSGIVQTFLNATDSIDRGRTIFRGTASAGSSNNLFVNNGRSVAALVTGGRTEFFDTSTAGNALFITYGGTGGNGYGGRLLFSNSSTAGDGTFTNNGGVFGATDGGGISFIDTSTAGNGTFTNIGATTNGAPYGFTQFVTTSGAGNPTAATGTFINYGGTATGALGGVTSFKGSSTASNATFTSNGGTAGGAEGGGTYFDDTSTASNALLIANAGSGGGLGGIISMNADSTGGTARAQMFGNGYLDLSFHNTPGVTIGSIEGNGVVLLGPNRLTIGSNNLSTSFSGMIKDAGQNGSLSKIGTGTLVFSGANTYTGPTQIDAGKLKVDGSITSDVTVNSGGTLGGSGTTGNVTVNSGGTVAPGDPTTLTVNGTYHQNGGATLRLAIAGTDAESYDRLVVLDGITLMSGAVLELDFINGFAPHTGDTFNLFASAAFTGSFSTIDIEGLQPGFQYALAPDANGNFQLTALNDGVPVLPTTVNISGTITYCSNSVVPGPLSNATLILTGSGSGSTLSDGSGSYQFSPLTTGGSYTVTPTKAALAPGSSGINTLDTIAAQQHFLNYTTLPPGCRQDAADVNSDGMINTYDVIAIQRFFIGRTSGSANVGKYRFTPGSRTYSAIVSNQANQNYDTLIFGDVVSPLADRTGEPSQAVAGDRSSAGELPSTVTAVTLPEVSIDQSESSVIIPVRTTDVDAKDKLVGFQGDFTFDERVVTFPNDPVQRAGLTGGNWNVSGNVLDGNGPIRTLRISAFSNDFTPLSGSGTLFELRLIRVSTMGQSTQLVWAAPPDNFVFIDANLNVQRPSSISPGSVGLSGKRK